MKNEPNKSSSLPLMIIGAVLVVAVIGGFIYYNSAKSSPANTNRAAANTNARNAQATAPLGAQPPNMIGSPTAAVTVEEFADFQCAACASVHPVMKEITSIYGGRIRFIFRNFPLAIPQHDKAYDAAVAVEAARMQDQTKFWELQNLLFQNQQAWTSSQNYRQIWEGYAQQIGLDVERFKADMASEAAKKRVNDDMARGRGLNVDSTPTVYVNGKPVPLQAMTTSNLRQIIDGEIQNAANKAPAANANPPAAAPANSTAAPAANR